LRANEACELAHAVSSRCYSSVPRVQRSKPWLAPEGAGSLIRGVASAASSRYYVCDMASGVPSTVIAQLRAEITGRLNNPADDVDDATLRQWVAELTEALAHMPVDARRGVVFGLLGTCFYRLHDVAASLDAHRKAALYTPDEADHANNIGTCHLMLGEFAEALDQFRRARALVGSHTNLGSTDSGTRPAREKRLSLPFGRSGPELRPKTFDWRSTPPPSVTITLPSSTSPGTCSSPRTR